MASDPRDAAGPAESAPIVRVERFRAAYGEKVVLDNVSFDVAAAEIVVLAGGSGCGKSTLMKHMIGLYPPAAGRILILGEDITQASGVRREALLRSFGVMYQSGALFGSMSLIENVQLPLEEFTDLPPDAIECIALTKLRLVGLEQAANLLPAEISGGMQKRAAIARAMALDPRILFLDEPSAGLDPITSAALDQLIIDLRHLLGVTFIIVTHELPSIFTIADRCVVLDAARRTMVALGAPAALRDASPDPFVHAFFNREAKVPPAGAAR
jgi:phospholipid/cholesterol/gamma-HCH transport system ATP-binding protein